ncbi:hypothetical protein ABW19_dt0202804 [Dactylella cylindrospora]|nr:hypothetical protein ABW19_dt0202804 [Dactylella cylindrospora]
MAMATRKHPVQAIAFANSDSPKLYLAISDTVYTVSVASRETLAKWKAPTPSTQNKKQNQEAAGVEKEQGDIEEVSLAEAASNGSTTTQPREPGSEEPDVAMKDASTPPSAVGKRKRSPSNSSVPALPSETTAEANTSEGTSKGTSKSNKKKRNSLLPGAPKKAVQPPNFIGHLLVIPDKGLLACTTLEDKTLRLLTSDGLVQIKEWVLHKRPSAICLLGKSTILVGDKFGDVYAYNIPADLLSPEPSSPTEGIFSDGALLLGHVSLLTTLTTASAPSLSEDTKRRNFIITADRDEHIRITYGEKAITHLIYGYCLGHTQFVSRLLIPRNQSHLLLSGGGDDWLGLWRWDTMKLLQKFDIRSIIEGIFEGDSRRELVDAMERYRRRRREEGDDKERITIAVSDIIEVTVPGSSWEWEVVVAVEGIPALLRLAYPKEGNGIKYIGHYTTPGPVLSVESAGGKIYFSCDTKTGPLVNCIEFAVADPIVTEFLAEEGFEGPTISEDEADGMVERLYTVEALRKGFGATWEED